MKKKISKMYKYDVALSFAGANREYVGKVAEILSKNGVRVFYDKFEDVPLWGKDLTIHFCRVYTKESKFFIPFISRQYKKRIWTNYELKNAIVAAIKRNEDYILPVRFDNTKLDGIRPTLGFLDISNLTPEVLAEKIIAKLQMEGEAV